MFKYCLFVFVLWYQILRCARTQSIVAPLVLDSSKHNCTAVAEELLKRPAVTMNGHNNYHVGQQVFYVYGEQQLKKLLGDNRNMENLGDYVFTPDIGAHKLHNEKIIWNDARRACIREGGHLAIINSPTEERVLLNMLQEKNIERGWLGLHDLYQEGDWVSILDEPLYNIGYARWTSKYGGHPDNYGGAQNCATLLNDGGMDDLECYHTHAYFCEISL